ncbi:MAG TPA: hypothetical protein VE445_02535, partial [Nitrososphaeraceae archaeon]|nr:hypothetical protein [Nitrososphaeraceae archaeon]
VFMYICHELNCPALHYKRCSNFVTCSHHNHQHIIEIIIGKVSLRTPFEKGGFSLILLKGD